MIQKENYIKSGLILLYIIYLFRWPFEVNQVIAFMGMLGFGYLANLEYDKSQFWFFIWAICAMVINPIYRLPLGRSLWLIVGFGMVLTICSSLLHKFIKTKKSA